MFSYERFGRENFKEAMKVTARGDNSAIDWSLFKYMVFDAPKLDADFQTRHLTLGTCFAKNARLALLIIFFFFSSSSEAFYRHAL